MSNSLPKSNPVTIDKDAVDHLSKTQRRGTMTMKKHDRPCECDDQTKVQMLTLEDGRRAERHVSRDEDGNEVVEIFAEEQRPLKLEKRIVKERKQIVAKETHETVRDGEVTQVEVRSLEPNVPMQVRERIGVAEHAKIVDGDYVRKEEVSQLIADGVCAGVEAMMANMEPEPYEEEVYDESEPVFKATEPPVFKAQSIIEGNVADKKKKDALLNMVMGVVIVAQLAFFGYMFLMM
jgi:hypothetical protein